MLSSGRQQWLFWLTKADAKCYASCNRTFVPLSILFDWDTIVPRRIKSSFHNFSLTKQQLLCLCCCPPQSKHDSCRREWKWTENKWTKKCRDQGPGQEERKGHHQERPLSLRPLSGGLLGQDVGGAQWGPQPHSPSHEKSKKSGQSTKTMCFLTLLFILHVFRSV